MVTEKSRSIWKSWWVLGAVILLIVGVVQIARPRPDPLVFVVLPAEVEERTAEQFAPLVDYLSVGLGREVKLMTVADYAAVVVALEYGHADIARMSPGSYIGAVDDLGLEIDPIASGIKKETGESYYYSYIITKADSGITDLNGASFAFVSVGSTSGHLIPSVYILEEGIELGKVVYSESHPAVIEAVRNGTIDAGCIASNRWFAAIDAGIIDEDTFTILWQSDPIPNVPIVVQRSMDSDLKAKLTTLFLDAPLDIVESMGVNEMGYEPIADSDYDVLRAALALKE